MNNIPYVELITLPISLISYPMTLFVDCTWLSSITFIFSSDRKPYSIETTTIIIITSRIVPVFCADWWRSAMKNDRSCTKTTTRAQTLDKKRK